MVSAKERLSGMTQENNPGVTAPVSDPADVSAQAIADQVEQGTNPEEQEIVEAPAAPDMGELLDEKFGKFESTMQGRMVNWSAEQNRTFQSEMRQELDTVLAPIKEQATMIEQARVSQLDIEEQAEYWRRKAEAPAAAPPPPTPPAQQQSGALSIEEQRMLASNVTGMLDMAGMQTHQVNEAGIFEGYQSGMSVDAVASLAKKNIRARNIGAAPTPTATTAPPVPPATPPSTGGAQRRGSNTANTRAEIAEAVESGNLNSNEIRRMNREYAEHGHTTY